MKSIGKKITALLSAAAVLFCPAALTANAEDGEPEKTVSLAEQVANDSRLISYAQNIIEQEQTPGMALVTVSGEDTAFRNWGYGGTNETENVTQGMAFEIGSVSKAFTALSVLLLQEEGKLSIEDSISDYLTWWDVTWQGKKADVKIWQVLNHCAGIPNSQTMAKMPFGSEDALKEQTARLVEGMELAYEPGTQFEYSNEDYNVLAFLTETVSGVPFDRYVTEEIFRPLGMKRSGYDIQTAQGYRYFFGQMTPYDAPRMKGAEGDGFVITTAEDMSCWIRAQLGTLPDVPEKLANAIEASHELPEAHRVDTGMKLENGNTLYYVNGWMQTEDGSYMLHTGLNPNFTSSLLINREKQVGAFAVANAWVNSADLTANAAYVLLTGETADHIPEASRAASYYLDRYAMYAVIACGVLVLLIFVVILTQKRRILRQQRTTKAEAILLVLRLFLLIPLLAACIALPYGVGYLMGYPGFGYKMIAYWTPLSLTAAFLAVDCVVLMLITASIQRYKKAVRGYW